MGVARPCGIDHFGKSRLPVVARIGVKIAF